MVLRDASLKDAVKVYKALGEPTRLKIVGLLCRHQELSCTQIGDLLDFNGSTLSHHLKQLTECGLLNLARKEGTYHFYNVNQDTLKRYVTMNDE